ncbi:MAG: spore germination protein GerW family protein [Microthrixaceae bacterium]
MEIQKLLTKLSDSMHASRSFGPASEHGDVTIVPVAIEVGGGGLGMGTHPADPTSGSPDTGDEPVPTGSGGGFGTVSFPLGVYVIKHGEVRWVPAIDATRVAIAAISLVRLVTKLRARSRT